MKSAAALFADVECLHASGVKPFKIVQHVLAGAGPGHIALTGTMNDSRLTFSSGEEITFDGKAWHFHPKEPDDGEQA